MRSYFIVVFPLLLLIAGMASPIPIYGDSAVDNSISVMLAEMKQINEKSKAENLTPENRDRLEELRENISKQGEEALPFLLKAIDEEQGSHTQWHLIVALSDIPGESVDRKLLDLFCADSEYASVAADRLLHRLGRSGPLTFRVPDEQIETLVEGIRQGKFYAGFILAQCAQNPQVLQCQPTVDRFVTEIKYTGEENDSMICTNFSSPRVMRLHRYLLTFKDLGPLIEPYLREAIEQARQANDVEVGKWLVIALGTIGATDVTDYLEDILKNDPDPYTRGVVISPYALCAGRKAIPLLKELFKDKTVNEYVHETAPGRHFISIGARAELIRLTDEEFQNTLYMRQINDVLARYGLSTEKVHKIGGKQRGDLLGDTKSVKDLNQVRQINAAFQRQDMEYILGYINERRQSDPNDPFPLLLEFSINLSYRNFEECIHNIEAMAGFVSRNAFPCDKFVVACISDMIISFEGTYWNYFLDPETSGTEELRLAFTSISTAYLFELEGCL